MGEEEGSYLADGFGWGGTKVLGLGRVSPSMPGQPAWIMEVLPAMIPFGLIF